MAGREGGCEGRVAWLRSKRVYTKCRRTAAPGAQASRPQPSRRCSRPAPSRDVKEEEAGGGMGKLGGGAAGQGQSWGRSP